MKMEDVSHHLIPWLLQVHMHESEKARSDRGRPRSIRFGCMGQMRCYRENLSGIYRDFRGLRNVPRYLWVIFLLKVLESFAYFSMSLNMTLYFTDEVRSCRVPCRIDVISILGDSHH